MLFLLFKLFFIYFQTLHNLEVPLIYLHVLGQSSVILQEFDTPWGLDRELDP